MLIKKGHSVVRKEIIRKRLNKLDEYLGVLKKLQRYSFKEFTVDPERYGSAERYLHLAIEAVIDMGNHVIADLELGVVNWYSDIPKLMADKEYISSELEEKWTRMIGFHNTLVHEYIDIDRKIVYDILQNNIRDLEELKRAFAQFL
jgi:uncharacterized protein YutE (UPF0331/DUF86 family)